MGNAQPLLEKLTEDPSGETRTRASRPLIRPGGVLTHPKVLETGRDTHLVGQTLNAVCGQDVVKPR